MNAKCNNVQMCTNLHKQSKASLDEQWDSLYIEKYFFENATIKSFLYKLNIKGAK